ncbi:hypothetical protein CR513_10501, partial [Mucuna pruriens]
MEHPQLNGQTEAANNVIRRGLRRRLEEAKGRWVEELPQVLWSYHKMAHSSTNETPFRFTFSIEAVIPVEIGEPQAKRKPGPIARGVRTGANKGSNEAPRTKVSLVVVQAPRPGPKENNKDGR